MDFFGRPQMVESYLDETTLREIARIGGGEFYRAADGNSLEQIFERIDAEFKSDYKYKYDLIRNLILELVHFGMKLQPAAMHTAQHGNAALRISSIFLELLERQFPIDESHTLINLRSPSDFAEHLNIHVNHLNRAVKEMTGKTTSQIISERLIQEAKVLLRQSRWNVSEIAFALGFTEVTHFNNFFKKQLGMSPTQFRKGS